MSKEDFLVQEDVALHPAGEGGQGLVWCYYEPATEEHG